MCQLTPAGTRYPPMTVSLCMSRVRNGATGYRRSVSLTTARTSGTRSSCSELISALAAGTARRTAAASRRCSAASRPSWYSAHDVLCAVCRQDGELSEQVALLMALDML